MGKANDNERPTNYWARTGYGDLTSYEGDAPPSRLTESTAVLRATLSTRNLYTQFVQYPLQPTDRQNVVNTISTVLETVGPFNSWNLQNSAIGRLASSPTTPLSEIGLIMLGKQLTNNFKSNLGQATYQNINIRNLFDGDPNTTFFESRDFRITKKEDQGTLSKFAERFFGYNPTADNPFDIDPTNDEVVRNTGQAQLNFMFGDGKVGGGINKNIYKPSDVIYGSSDLDLIQPRSYIVGSGSHSETRTYHTTDSATGLPITEQRTSTLDTGIRSYFDSFITNPYSQINASSTESINSANNAMDAAYYETGINPDYGQEYAPKQVFVDEEMGEAIKRRERELGISGDEFYVRGGQVIGEHDDELSQRIVWGRDGVDEHANSRLASLRGLTSLNDREKGTAGNIKPNNNLDTFNAKFGLLKYTSELLNASEGQLVDQTRKIYKKNGKITGLNGSGLWSAPDYSLFPDTKGLRQHSVLDQYDRFPKAIRFDGNNVYQGSENSVVNKSVLPRVHPTSEDSRDDLKNLTFSLENLAVHVIYDENSNYGIIDDEQGTLIPKSEAGPFGGRLMWFPPYIESFNEVAIANYDPTVMVGRSEPIYTYMHSERTATLSFKLIMDYPEHVRNFKTYRGMANFFAFGGTLPPPQQENEPQPVPPPEPTPVIPEVTPPEPFVFSFPNNVPKPNATLDYNLIDYLYNDVKYDIKKGLDNTEDTDSYKINNRVFLVTGITPSSVDGKYELHVPPGFTQSQARFVAGTRELDDAIYEMFNDPKNAEFYQIRIVGKATVLYTPTIAGVLDTEQGIVFNKDLGTRRAKVMESFVKERIKKVLGKSFESTNINIIIDSTGDAGADPDNFTIESIPELDAKKERIAEISFIPTDKTTTNEIDNPTSEEQRAEVADKIENQNKQSTENVQGKSTNFMFEERTIENDAILNDMKALTKKYFYPAFHSQTPEDFHRRLTFLQQCTRQGSAIRSNPEVDENGISRAKNSVFGRQPICILRVGDFFYTKVIIENITIDYDENVWDTNPEGRGMQPMIGNVTLQMKVIGGQSLQGPIDALQNAVAFNFYANSTYATNGDKGIYTKATKVADDQDAYRDNVVTTTNKKDKR